MAANALDQTRGVFLVEKETTSGGSAATLAADDAVRIIGDFGRTIRGAPIAERTDYHSPHAGGIQPIATGYQGWEFAFATECFAPATLGDIDDNNVGDLWRACPVKITETGATSVAIAPTSQTFLGARTSDTSYTETCTLGYYELGGNYYRGYNGVCRFTVAGEIGQVPRINWGAHAKWVAPDSNAGGISTATFTGDRAGAPFLGSTVSFGGNITDTGRCITAFEFDPGIDFVEIPCATETNGFDVSLAEHNRPASLVLTVYADNEDDFDPWAFWGAGGDAPYVQWGSAGNRIRITLPQATLVSVEVTSIGEARGYTCTFAGYPSASGNDQYAILMD